MTARRTEDDEDVLIRELEEEPEKIFGFEQVESPNFEFDIIWLKLPSFFTSSREIQRLSFQKDHGCVPLYDFSYIYNYFMASPRSLVDSFRDKKEGCYNPKMSPIIPRNKW